MAITTLVGQEGMTILQYNGTNTGDQTWFGKDNRRYRFSAHRPQAYVDSRDVDFMLKKYLDSNQQPVFSVSKPAESKPKVSDKEPDKEPDVVITETDPFEEDVVTVAEIDAPDPNELTIGDLKTWLETGPDKAAVEHVLAIEEGGLNRKGALSAISDYLDMA